MAGCLFKTEHRSQLRSSATARMATMATSIAPNRIVALIQRNFRELNLNRMEGATVIEKKGRQHLTRSEQNRNIR
jgi:hypothetical protein